MKRNFLLESLKLKTSPSLFTRMISQTVKEPPPKKAIKDSVQARGVACAQLTSLWAAIQDSLTNGGQESKSLRTMPRSTTSYRLRKYLILRDSMHKVSYLFQMIEIRVGSDMVTNFEYDIATLLQF